MFLAKKSVSITLGIPWRSVVVNLLITQAYLNNFLRFLIDNDTQITIIESRNKSNINNFIGTIRLNIFIKFVDVHKNN